MVVLFGLFMLGLFKPGWLQRDLRLHVLGEGGQPVAAYALGLAFGFGWTPCIGPVLGAILTVVAAQAKVTEGVALLAVYSLGLGLPFVLAALFTDELIARCQGDRPRGTASSACGRRHHGWYGHCDDHRPAVCILLLAPQHRPGPWQHWLGKEGVQANARW
jgi:cytochrome c biogenesis protein CcdA